MSPRAGVVSAPVLPPLHGTALPVRSAREWPHTLPDARLVLLGGIGHVPCMGRRPAGARP